MGYLSIYKRVLCLATTVKKKFFLLGKVVKGKNYNHKQNRKKKIKHRKKERMGQGSKNFYIYTIPFVRYIRVLEKKKLHYREKRKGRVQVAEDII